jgi:hypothetical protein
MCASDFQSETPLIVPVSSHFEPPFLGLMFTRFRVKDHMVRRHLILAFAACRHAQPVSSLLR